MDSREKVVAMRLAGAPVRKIATQTGLELEVVESIIANELDVLTAGDSRQAARLELARLDALLMPVWNQAIRGDVTAVSQALKIVSQRSALLSRLEDEPPVDDSPALSVADRVARLKMKGG